MAALNKQVLLASRPQGAVTEDNFRIVEVPVDKPGPGEVLVRNEWLSLDPYMRGRMSDAKSYAKSAEIGEVMVGQTVGEVVESRDPNLKSGDKVLTPLGWQLYGIASAKELTRIDAKRAPVSYYLGILGMPGITAWFGLFEIGQPKPGNTVVVSAASGAVGSIVGQLAKIKGCRVVGIAGGKTKCDYVVKELGFDACIDYKAGNLLADLREHCPKGVDVDFENVGGVILDTVLRVMNLFSRIVVCGLIAEYSATEPYGYKMLRSVLVNRIKMQGMIFFDWKDRYSEALDGLSGYLAEGKLKYRESIVDGIDKAPKGLIALLKGDNFGKQLVKLA
ncbi:MAG TPA: NADP-dependent oxidoreductase [Casimicrobiaceae bacterium]|jgi:NADPH-dependent curcumin reductase CurA|nr:NADP-dependent oxidoreductase [Casimicrobiaceae bacterium]